MRVSACPNCASLRLRMPNIGDGGVLGYSTLISVVCEDCGFSGSPLLLDNEQEYQRFRGEAAGAAPPLEGEAAEREADEEERAALSPAERAFLEDAQTAGEPRRPWFTVIFILTLGFLLMVATPFAVIGFVAGVASLNAFPVLVGATAALWALQGWAFFRIARRMWVKAVMG